MTSHHLEIEAKYDVAAGQQLPDLVGTAGVRTVVTKPEIVLTASYFDTTTHALSAAGATLRRRTGGDDDGWHLKLKVADGERLEVHRPLGRSQTPPATLTALVRALVGPAELVAVAALSTRRTVHTLLDDEGRALAELADDTVTGERFDAELPAVTWREAEIELVDGDRDLLAALGAAIQAAGIAPASSSSKVGRVLQVPAAPPAPGAAPVSRKASAAEVLDGGLRHSARAVLTADPLLRVDRGGAPERMRSAVRRLRAALAVRRQVAPEQATDRLRSELAWLETVMAGLVDIEGAHRRIRAALAGEPKELLLGPVARRTDRELAAARKAALVTIREVLDSDRYLRLMGGVQGLVDATALPAVDGRARDALPALAERAVRRVVRRLGQLRRAQSVGERRWQLVGCRRAVERARYAELLSPGRGSGRDSTLELLEEIAGVLAEADLGLQTQGVLRTVAVQAQLAGENAFTFGRLHGMEELHAADLKRQLSVLRKALKRAAAG